MLAYAKALAAGLISGLSALSAALASSGVSSQEWVTIALAFVIGTGIVAAVPNKTTP